MPNVPLHLFAFSGYVGELYLLYNLVGEKCNQLRNLSLDILYEIGNLLLDILAAVNEDFQTDKSRENEIGNLLLDVLAVLNEDFQTDKSRENTIFNRVCLFFEFFDIQVAAPSLKLPAFIGSIAYYC